MAPTGNMNHAHTEGKGEAKEEGGALAEPAPLEAPEGVLEDRHERADEHNCEKAIPVDVSDVTRESRELAYVAMSRARVASHVYTTAADPAEAVEHVAYSWEAERRPTWATDQGKPAEPPAQQPELETLHEQLNNLVVERGRFEYDLQQLRQGSGRWADTPAGHAASHLTRAEGDYRRAANRADEPGLRRRERRAADDELGAARHALQAAKAEWKTHGQPQASRIETLIDSTDRTVRNTLDAIRAQQAQKPWASLHRAGPSQMRRSLGKNHDLGVG
jgi:hypothetical protein